MTTAPVPIPALPSPPLEQQASVRTWRPKTAGILNIVAGSLGLIAGIVLVAIHYPFAPWGVMTDGLWTMYFSPLFTAAGIVIITMSIVTIVSGIYYIKRRVWGLALAGSILALILVFFLGIPSIVFVAQAKKEFA